MNAAELPILSLMLAVPIENAATAAGMHPF